MAALFPEAFVHGIEEKDGQDPAGTMEVSSFLLSRPSEQHMP